MLLGIPLILWMVSFIVGTIFASIFLTLDSPFHWIALYMGIIIKNVTARHIYGFVFEKPVLTGPGDDKPLAFSKW
jgi:hypothetical protein